MRIAVVGVGAVGGYFGGRLAQAGHDVVFLARGATLETVQSCGLEVRSIAGDFRIDRPNAADDPRGVGPVDLILLAVKATQVRELSPSLRPLVGPETSVIPIQNGLESPAIVADALGASHVLGGLCKIFASKSGPATVEHIGLEPVIEFGELDGVRSERVERIRTALAAAVGMSAIVPTDITAAMWQKLLYVEPLGAVGAVTRQPAGVLRSIPETRRLLQSAMEEIVALALRRAVAIDPDLPAQAIARVDQLPAGATTSMHRDIIAGNPSEFEFQVGTLVRFARESAVPVPVHELIYAALLPSELEARRRSPA